VAKDLKKNTSWSMICEFRSWERNGEKVRRRRRKEKFSA